ncbi:MAG TPA: TIR domain-containing protein [Allosphingosinicella sp.]|nr:TIR domain-containing protein [Allosphingosinicella sp.]
MADVFFSHARADEARAAAVAAAIEADGRSLSWDRDGGGGADHAAVAEREIAAAGSVVIAWSRTARDSLWMRGEANEALDQGKLVQINLDGARPPLPFAMLPFHRFTRWSGEREQAPWPQLRDRIDAALGIGAEVEPGGRRPDPGGVPVFVRREPALQGFGRAAVLGWAALVTAALLALSVLAVAQQLISADAFGVIAIAAAIVSVGLLAVSAYNVLRTVRGSRR